MHLDISTVGTLRSEVFSLVAIKLRQFKLKLARTLVFGSKRDENPCNKYTIIDEETMKTRNGRLVHFSS